MNSFRKHPMKNLGCNLHALLFRCEYLVEEKLVLLLACLPGCYDLFHNHVLCLSELILDVIADSILGHLHETVLILDCFLVMFLYGLQ